MSWWKFWTWGSKQTSSVSTTSGTKEIAQIIFKALEGMLKQINKDVLAPESPEIKKSLIHFLDLVAQITGDSFQLSELDEQLVSFISVIENGSLAGMDPEALKQEVRTRIASCMAAASALEESL